MAAGADPSQNSSSDSRGPPPRFRESLGEDRLGGGGRRPPEFVAFPCHGLPRRFYNRHPEVTAWINLLAKPRRQRERDVNESAVPAADEKLGIPRHCCVDGIPCHIPAVDAIVRKGRNAPNMVTWIDIF